MAHMLSSKKNAIKKVAKIAITPERTGATGSNGLRVSVITENMHPIIQHDVFNSFARDRSLCFTR
jgi:hypothetical protein